jgi:signal transduction histidine kinase
MSFPPGSATLLLLATGVGYVLVRCAARVLWAWDRLRRRRMLWALTHAHLMIVALAALLIAIVVFVSSVFFRGAGSLQPASVNGWIAFVTWVLDSLFPALSLLLVLTFVAMLFLLPPSALFSFFAVRRTARRIEDLAAAARAFQAGDYRKGVAVAGEDEVAQLQVSFNAMAGDPQRTLLDLQTQRDAVAELLRSRRELVAGVSHELRTPVATVRAALEGIQNHPEEPLSPRMRHDLGIMEGEVLRLQRLLDDLFTLARVEVGQLALTCRPTDVAPIARRMVEALAPWAWNTGRVEMVAELPAGLPRALVDEARLEQILANLLRNAGRHTPPGGARYRRGSLHGTCHISGSGSTGVQGARAIAAWMAPRQRRSHPSTRRQAAWRKRGPAWDWPWSRS